MAGYQERIGRLRDLDVAVVALSVDTEEDAAGTVERLGLDFRVLWGAEAELISRRYGAWVHDDGYLQPVGFLLRRGDVRQATYSTGALGRLRAEEVVAWVEHVRQRQDG